MPIDHSNGIFAGTNNYIAEIGGRPPMTVEEFVTRNRKAFVLTGTIPEQSICGRLVEKGLVDAALRAP
jgi:hypothetical protein